MFKRGFWKKERMLPGQSAVEEVCETYWMLRLIHPPTASALAAGGLGGIWLAWTLLRGHAWLALVLGLLVGLVAGAVLGVVVYWLVRGFAARGH